MEVHSPREIAQLVRERRARLKLSQAELASRIGASRQWVQGLESGKPGVELGLTLRALRAVGIRLDVQVPAAGIVQDRAANHQRSQDGFASKRAPHRQEELTIVDIDEIVARPPYGRSQR